MKKRDFLEILKDYLKNDFSKDELTKILKDYEEFFIYCEIEGKSEIEIIKCLGSPKDIALGFISQNEKSVMKKKESKLCKLYNNIIKKFKKIMLNLKVDLDSEKHIEHRNKAKLFRVVTNIALIPFAGIVGVSTVVFGVTLIYSLVSPIFYIPIIHSIENIIPQLRLIITLACIGYVVIEILLWKSFVKVIKLEKKAINRYNSFMKMNKLYINASVEKEKLSLANMAKK